MGSLVAKAANGIGGAIASIFAAPFRTIFGGSCEGVCGGPWDVVCFIEHLCVSNLGRFFMILGLCYMTLLFIYLLFKLGICQCITRSLCKMCWAVCESCWFALEDITCFLFRKLKNTKRVNRRRRYRYHPHHQDNFYDIEIGYNSNDKNDTSDNYYDSFSHRKRKLIYHRGKHSKRHDGRSLHHHLRLKARPNVGRIGVGRKSLISKRSSTFKRRRLR